MKVIEPIAGHEASCACATCVAERKVMVRSNHPLINKEIKAQKILIPVEQAIAQLCEARDCYSERIAEIDLKLKDLRDE